MESTMTLGLVIFCIVLLVMLSRWKIGEPLNKPAHRPKRLSVVAKPANNKTT